jgi:hypothetical protein
MNRSYLAVPVLVVFLACGGSSVDVGGPQSDAGADGADPESCAGKSCGDACGGGNVCSEGQCIPPNPGLCRPAFDAGEDAVSDAASPCAGKKCGDACGGGNVCSGDQCVAPTPGLCGPQPDAGPADLCVATGGSVVTTLCCSSQNDFTDTCGIGSCSCAPTSSHDIQTCMCPAAHCYQPGTGCRSQ